VQIKSLCQSTRCACPWLPELHLVTEFDGIWSGASCAGWKEVRVSQVSQVGCELLVGVMSRSDVHVYFGVGEIHVEVRNLMRCKSEACVCTHRSEGSVKLQSDWGSKSDDHNSEVSCLEETGVTFTDLIFCRLAGNICSRSDQWNSSLSPTCTHTCLVRLNSWACWQTHLLVVRRNHASSSLIKISGYCWR